MIREFRSMSKLTGQLRRSPIVLAACNSSPNDSRFRWSICWLKKRRVDAFSTAKNKRRQIKIKMTGAWRERRKRTVGKPSVRGPFFVLKAKNGDGWQQGGKTKKVLYCLSLTRVRWWRHNAPALWTAAGRRMPHSYGTRTADTHGEGRVGR